MIFIVTFENKHGQEVKESFSNQEDAQRFVDRLPKPTTTLIIDTHRTRLHEQVKAFFAIAEQEVATTPRVPSMEVAKLRARLVIEEAFEFAEALFPNSVGLRRVKEDALQLLSLSVYNAVNFPAAIDALADLDYVVEGARIAFGVDGGPIADEVQRANLAKVGGPKDAHGKKLKPVGWTPPDIEGELRKQGWDDGK